MITTRTGIRAMADAEADGLPLRFPRLGFLQTVDAAGDDDGVLRKEVVFHFRGRSCSGCSGSRSMAWRMIFSREGVMSGLKLEGASGLPVMRACIRRKGFWLSKGVWPVTSS